MSGFDLRQAQVEARPVPGWKRGCIPARYLNSSAKGRNRLTSELRTKVGPKGVNYFTSKGSQLVYTVVRF